MPKQLRVYWSYSGGGETYTDRQNLHIESFRIVQKIPCKALAEYFLAHA